MFRSTAVILSIFTVIGCSVNIAKAQSPSGAADQACDSRAPGFLPGIDVPIYPGAKEVGACNFSAAKSVETSLARFQSEDPPVKIADYYRLEMRQRGWQLFEFLPNPKDSESINTDRWQVILTRKGLKRVDFFISREASNTTITLAGAESAGVLSAGGTMSEFGSIYLSLLGRLKVPKRLRQL